MTLSLRLEWVFLAEAVRRYTACSEPPRVIAQTTERIPRTEDVLRTVMWYAQGSK